MAQHTPLYIIASQHPRVGKTLVARLLIEYFRLSGRPIVGYDLDPREPALASHFPSFIWPVDIADTRGQMALFDRLVADDWRTTVLDIGYGLFDQFFTVLPEIGFEQEAARRGIVPIVLFITDAAPTTARRYAELQKRLPRTIFVPVHNEATAFMFIQRLSADTAGMRRHPHPAAVADRARRHRPARFLVRDLSRQAAWRTDRGPYLDRHHFFGVSRAGIAAAHRRARILAARLRRSIRRTPQQSGLAPPGLIASIRSL